MGLIKFSIFLLCLIPTLCWALAGERRPVEPADNMAAVAKVGDGTGVLIGPKLILTGGHVLGLGQMKAELVEVRFTESSEPDRKFKIKNYKVAERGRFPTRYLDHSGQDLAVILLEEDVEKALSIKPVKLYEATGKKLIGKSVTLVGHGRSVLDEQGRCSGKSSEKLLMGESQVKELLNEEGGWGAPLIIQSPKLTPCDGDSGGPALYYESKVIYVVGVTSGPYNPTPGTHLGRAFQYADVGSANDWIEKAIEVVSAPTPEAED